MARKQRTSWKLNIPFADLKKMVPLVMTGMEEVLPMAGYELQRSSTVFQRSNGTFTFRLVYREEHDGQIKRSMVFVIRNIPDHRSQPKVVND